MVFLLWFHTPQRGLDSTTPPPSTTPALPVHDFLNGIAMSNIIVDTTSAATDTIDHVATDQNGLTSMSTRTIVVETPSIVLAAIASTTEAPDTAP
jgi:hypothetical protein